MRPLVALGGVPAAEELFAGVDEVFGCNVETWPFSAVEVAT